MFCILCQPADVLDRTANPSMFPMSFGFSSKRSLIALIISLTTVSVETSATIEIELREELEELVANSK
jgi:hypothetical protein